MLFDVRCLTKIGGEMPEMVLLPVPQTSVGIHMITYSMIILRDKPLGCVVEDMV
jgi:hypothetical protein